MSIEEARADLMLAQADISYRPKDDSIDIAIKALEDITTISGALIGICDQECCMYECCMYGMEDAVKLAKKYMEAFNVLQYSRRS